MTTDIAIKNFCNAKKRQGDGFCTRPAGWGTNHAGIGSCKLHGGSTRTHVVASMKKVPSPKGLRELANEYATDSDVFNLRPQIATLKAAVESLGEGKLDNNGNWIIPPVEMYTGELAMLTNSLVKAVKTLHDIEVGRKYVIDVADVTQMLDNLKGIIFKYIPDPLVQSKMANEIEASFVIPGEFREIDE